MIKLIGRLFTVSLLTCQSLPANAAVIGQTYDIEEPDALMEIEQKVASVDWGKALDKPTDQWSALQGETLPYAAENRSRSVVPFYTTEFEITDQTGRVTYPKGFTFNPLEFVTLPQRIVVIDPRQESWLAGHVTASDQILFTHGNVLKAKERLHVPIFILDAKTRSRLDIQVVPTIVEQKGKMLVLHEFVYQEQEVTQ
ncbi:hypothetical protein [Aeromonas hydrophila]|uniref:hypothetical protein n=1 Tax=Aeromonas hydrophila TaxID=644 RepID=UPI001C5B02CC|nr:hypothetical protein [Aeromonas hydrophila]